MNSVQRIMNGNLHSKVIVGSYNIQYTLQLTYSNEFV